MLLQRLKSKVLWFVFAMRRLGWLLKAARDTLDCLGGYVNTDGYGKELSFQDTSYFKANV